MDVLYRRFGFLQARFGKILKKKLIS